MGKGGDGVEQRELVERLLRRDETGMEELLRHYGPLMKYVIAPILPDPRDREDCLSEAALRVWERIGQFDGELGRLAHRPDPEHRLKPRPEQRPPRRRGPFRADPVPGAGPGGDGAPTGTAGGGLFHRPPVRMGF